MNAALLCNGPSRVVYNPEIKYNYVIGCNVPWADVDATVIMDIDVLQKFNNDCKFYISRKAWIECPNNLKHKFVVHLLGIFDTLPDYDSAGHVACRKLLELGAKQIDIYGCDSWFKNNTESYTHQFVDSRSENMSKHVSVWRARWYELMAKNQDVQFNFIGENK